MENYTKEEIMNLSDDDLLVYINLMLAEGYSLNQLEREGKISKDKVSRKLNKMGYKYDRTDNAYIPVAEIENKPKEPKPKKNKRQEKAKNSPNSSDNMKGDINTLDDILKRLEVLELALNGIINTKNEPTEEKKQEFKPIIFKSKQHPRNYPLHTEVVELLMQVSEDHSHLKVKDIVNHALYIGLQQIKHSDSIE